MQPAVGPAKHMNGILMSAEMQDNHGKPFGLVVPNVSVHDPAMSDSLIPVGRLIKAGVTVNHRIPSQANEDGFSVKAVLLYGGTFTTPDGKTIIVMEYAQHTWRLPCHLPSASQNQICCRALLLKIVLPRARSAAHLSILAIHSTC